MRPRALVLWAVLAAAVPAGALEARFDLGTSVTTGAAYELVLRDGTYADPVSRLIWPVPLEVNLTLGVELPWSPVTTTLVEAVVGWPVLSGRMVDEDWRTGTGSSDIRYGISTHTGWATDRWQVRAEQRLTLGGWGIGVGGTYRFAAWDAWNGSHTYQLNDGTIQEGPFSGLVLQYRQIWYLPFLALSYRQENSRGGWSSTLDLSPFTWCSDLDNHLSASKRLTFLDYTSGGVFGRERLEWRFGGPGGLQIGLRASAEIAWGAVGSTVETYPTTGTVAFGSTDKVAGAWYWETSLTAFVRN